MATNSYIMSSLQKDLKNEELFLPNIVIPASPLTELQSLLANTAGTKCILNCSEKHLLINISHNLTLVYIRLLEGKYPVDRQFIPKDHPIKVKSKRSDLFSTLERVSSLGSEHVEMKISGKTVHFYAAQDQIGDLQDELTDVTIEGGETEVAFKPQNVLTALKHQKYEQEDIILEIKDGLSPFLITLGDENTQLFSPLRVK